VLLPIKTPSQDTSVDFSLFNVDENSVEEIICEDDNDIIQSTEDHIREKPMHKTQTAKKTKTLMGNFRPELLKLEENKIKLLQSEEKDDEDFMFLKSLLPDLKSLDHKK